MNPTSDDLNKAIVLLIGWKMIPYPKLDESRIFSVFDERKANILVDKCLHILSQFSKLGVNRSIVGLTNRADDVVSRLHTLHPELNADAREALAWAWSFGNK